MAAGSRRKFALDLNDIFAFPDGDHLPIRPPITEEGESWVILVEVGQYWEVSYTNTHDNMIDNGCHPYLYCSGN